VAAEATGARASGGAVVGPDGLVRERGLVAAPDQEAPGAVALEVPSQRAREALGEQHGRRLELRVPPTVREGGLDQVGWHAAALEVARDALAPPALEGALVLREAAGVAGVVDVARLGQLGDRGLDRVVTYLSPAQELTQLRGRAVALGERPPGEIERAPALAFGSGLRYAAFSSGSFAAPLAALSASTATSAGRSCGSTPAAS
jgi:hypothetical protein